MLARLLLALCLTVFIGAAIVLNYAEELALDDVRLESQWFSQWYPQQRLNLEGSYSDGHWFFQYKNYVYKDHLPWQMCAGEFIAAAQLSDILIVACSDELLWFDRFQRLVDRANASYGLPEQIDAIGMIGEQVFIRSAENAYNLDLESMELYVAISTSNVEWLELSPVPEVLSAALEEEQQVSLQTVLEDVFYWFFISGERPWIIDSLILLWLVLACSKLVRRSRQESDELPTLDDPESSFKL